MRISSPRSAWVCIAAFPLCGPFEGVSPHSASAALEVNVSRVGFSTLQSSDVLRPGVWTPVFVDVSLVNQTSFDGRVRLGQFDLDGDEAFDSVELHLSAATGGHQRVMLLTLPSFVGRQGRLVVEVQSADGEAVEMVSQGEVTRQAVPSRPPEPITDDELLILSVSEGTIGRFKDLTDADQEGGYARTLNVAHMSPADLPDHWVGLESVDIIRWDGANAGQLSPTQTSALVEWVRQGGLLMIMVSTADGSFSLKKTMDEVLPCTMGELAQISRLDQTFERLLQPYSDPTEVHQAFASPVPALRCTKREGSEILAMESSIRSDLITRRREGHGWVVLCGMMEKDLFATNGSAQDFYRRVLMLERGMGSKSGQQEPATLFPEVTGGISFATKGSVYLALAAFFSIAYVALATFGSWAFLTARGWRHHSWSAFAAVAVLASVGTVLAVNTVRGFGDKLRQITIVDLEAGKGYGKATTLLGLKPSSDRQLDFWLPSDGMAVEPAATHCFLRPIRTAFVRDAGGRSFADPQSYRVLPSTAVLEGVRMRATLKQFEGRWRGRVGGKVRANITIEGEKGREYGWRITDDSYVINELGTVLRDCYLLQPLSDTMAPIERVYTDDEQGQLSAMEKDQHRETFINAFPIGNLPADGSKVALAERCYRPMVSSRPEFDVVRDWKLDDAMKGWTDPLKSALERLGGSFGPTTPISLGNEENALMLLSTVGEFPGFEVRGTLRQMVSHETTWSHDGLRHLDLREQLQRDCVYLIGFADHAGPVKLYRRSGDRPFTPIEPEAGGSWTMYRIRIPVTLETVNRPRAAPAATGSGSD